MANSIDILQKLLENDSELEISGYDPDQAIIDWKQLAMKTACFNGGFNQMPEVFWIYKINSPESFNERFKVIQESYLKKLANEFVVNGLFDEIIEHLLINRNDIFINSAKLFIDFDNKNKNYLLDNNSGLCNSRVKRLLLEKFNSALQAAAKKRGREELRNKFRKWSNENI